MKTNLSFAMNPATNEALVPAEMLRAGSTAVRSVIDFMMLYGVDKLEVGQHAHGTITLLSPRLRLLKKVDIPPWLDSSRKQSMHHLSHLMIIMGLLGVEIILDPDEIDAIKERWQSCERAATSTATDIGQVAQLLAPEGGVPIANSQGNVAAGDPDSGAE